MVALATFTLRSRSTCLGHQACQVALALTWDMLAPTAHTAACKVSQELVQACLDVAALHLDAPRPRRFRIWLGHSMPVCIQICQCLPTHSKGSVA